MDPNGPKLLNDIDISKKDAIEGFDKSIQSFFSGGIDLIKWTVTIITAAIIWIAARPFQESSISLPIPFSLLCALIFFVMSIFFAGVIVIFVQLYWANQINKYGSMIELYTNPDFCKILGIPKEMQQTDAIRSFTEASAEIRKQAFFHNPRNYICIIGLHLVFLLFALISLVFYIVN
jgi:hypothetical protein